MRGRVKKQDEAAPGLLGFGYVNAERLGGTQLRERFADLADRVEELRPGLLNLDIGGRNGATRPAPAAPARAGKAQALPTPEAALVPQVRMVKLGTIQVGVPIEVEQILRGTLMMERAERIRLVASTDWAQRTAKSFCDVSAKPDLADDERAACTLRIATSLAEAAVGAQ